MVPAKQKIYLESSALQNKRLSNSKTLAVRNFHKLLKVGTYFVYSPSKALLCARDTLQSDFIRLVKPLSLFSSLSLCIDFGLFVVHFINFHVSDVWSCLYYLSQKPC